MINLEQMIPRPIADRVPIRRQRKFWSAGRRSRIARIATPPGR